MLIKAQPTFVAGNYYDKYRSRNPLYQRLLGNFLATAVELIRDVPAASILEAGAGPGDLVIACEVLEHLDAPDQALSELQRVCRGQALVSVPNEPLWRMLNVARGKYWRSPGNTPGHLQNLPHG